MEANPPQIKAEPSRTNHNNSLPLSMDASSGAHQLSVIYNTVSDGSKHQLGLISVPHCQNDGQRIGINVVYMDQSASLSNSIKSEYYSSDTERTQRIDGNVLDPLVNLTRSTGKTTEMISNNAFQRSFSTLNDSGPEIADSNDTSQMKSTSLVTSKPSEALFVRALIGRCKRIAPLWFRGVSSMRERNREENRRMASNNGQSQSDWSLIGLKIAEMNAASETDAVANLLKKLYKELPTDSVFWFLKCWLGSEDSLNDPESCVISRGDAKGRMRRIDGGKGSDKVWRLDTIVGMLYHGLPMSSTDTNIMVHTCDQELCVRPQHIRFRASSVALVVVLKALAQAGYTVIPPPVAAGPNGVAPNASDESVDVFGPFTIEELQQYRSENLTPAEDSISKLTLNASDRDFADTVPVIRAALQGIRCDAQPPVIPSSQPMISHLNGYNPPGARVKMEPAELAYHRQRNSTVNAQPNLGPMHPDSDSPRLGMPAGVVDITRRCSPNSSQLGRPTVTTTNSTVANATTTATTTSTTAPQQQHPLSNLDETVTDGMPNSPSSVCLPVTNCLSVGHRVERRSLKRPAPSDSPCSFPSSPIRMSQHHSHRPHQAVPPPSSSPPLLISDMANSMSVSHHHHHHHHHPHHHQRHPSMPHHQHRHLSSDSTIQAPILLSSSSVLPCLTQTTSEPGSVSRCNQLIATSSDSNSPFSSSIGSDNPRPPDTIQHPSFQTNGQVGTTASGSPNSCPVMVLHQPLALPMNHHSLTQQAVTNGQSGFVTSTNTTTAITATSSSSGLFVVATPNGGGGSSSSGKTTPRQPAKKRLEARTPTIEGNGLLLLLDDGGSRGTGSGLRGTPVLGAGSDDSNPAMIMNTGNGGGAIAFRVHQNTPFVPVQSRSGRPSSSGSASSGGIVPNQTISNETGTGAPLLTVPSHRMPEAEEGEMDQELVDIMVRRSGSTSGCCPTDGATSGAQSCALRADAAGHRALAYPTGLSTHPELGNSPTGRRIIEAFVASLAVSHGSPLHGNSTPINPRRSASACSLPRVGASPNDDLTEFLLHPSVNGSSRFFASPTGPPGSSWYPLHNNSNQKSHWLRDESHAMMTGRKSAGAPAQRGNVTPPPAAGPELRLLSGTRVLGQSTLHTPTLNGDGLGTQDSSSSVQELESLIRNSPASGISQELIDMLANMAQQYGVQQPRAGSRASRPSSQVAQRFYRSLVNGSVCGSPFLVSNLGGSGTSNNSSGSSNTAVSAQPLSGANGSGSVTSNACGTANPLLSPTGSAASAGQFHLRGLSFTPLAVDAELGYSSSAASATAISASSPVKHSCAMETTTSATMVDLPAHLTEFTSSTAMISTTTATTVAAASSSSSISSGNNNTGNPVGNGFFSYRRPLKQ